MNLWHWGKNIFYKTFQAIWKRKFLFLTLFIVQLIYLSLISYVVVDYQLVIFEDLTKISTPFENMELEAENMDSLGELVGQYGAVHAAYRSLLNHLFGLASWLALLFVVPNAILWIGSGFLLSKGWNKKTNWKNKLVTLSKSWLKYLISAFIIFIPFLIVAYFATISIVQIAEGFIPVMSYVLLGLFFFLAYLLLVCFSLITISNWKHFLQAIVKVAFKKIHYSIVMFLLSLIFIFLPMLLFYYSVMIWTSFFLMLSAALLLLFAFIYTKIFLVAAWHEILRLK